MVFELVYCTNIYKPASRVGLGMSKLQFRVRSKRPAETVESKPFGIPIYELLANEKNNVNKQKPRNHGPPPHKIRRTTKTLLAQEYKPTEFFELLGNDDANRRILKWLTQWDKAIKGTFVPSDDLDELGRPLQKILLLSGPPGVGKTTAAHICAAQKGFEVFEVNASDDRGGNAVKEKIQTALGSHLVNTQKPVCIIADEVDGATEHGFIRSLINLIKPKSQKRQREPLMRPIIAICNELYAPALRPLRPVSMVVKFERHAPALLIHRLEKICRMENYKYTTRELNNLVEKHQCDLRACLNDLQFSSKNSNKLESAPSTNESPFSDVNSTDAYFLARTQFTAPKPVSLAKLDTCTDQEKLVDQLFASYLDVDFVDDMLKKPNEFSDFLVLADNYNSDLKPVVASAFGYYFRPPSATGAQLNFKQQNTVNPSQRYETFKQTKQIVQQVLKHAECPQIRSSFSRSNAVLEFMPFLARVALPLPERAVSAAKILKSAGIKYKHTNEALILEPQIELAAVYDEQQQERVRTGQFLVRAQGLEVFKQSRAVQAPIKSAEPKQIISKQKDATADSKVWVQFSEGFSNAVRKPISWSELFGP